MKRIPCEYFGEGEKIYFNIGRILQLEAVLKKPIGRILAEGLGMTEVLVAFEIGLAHYKRRSSLFYQEKIQEMMNNTDFNFNELMITVQKALIASGVMGKKIYYQEFPEEATEEDNANIEAEEALNEKN